MSGVSKACSKIGGFICPFTPGNWRMVSSICDLVEEESITDARRVCRECAQGKRSSKPYGEHQGDILQQVQKVNEAMKSIHKELNNITL